MVSSSLMQQQVTSKNVKKSKENVVKNLYNKYVNVDFVKKLLFNVEYLPIISVLILIGELILNIFVIQRVSYTEIDWNAYMQECEGFLNGTTNYAQLKGDTGPLVYPAGFVYIYSFLYFITSHGQNIRLAQYIFVAIYLLQMCLVLRLYTKSRKVPPYVMILSAFTSYRIHSIYVLRLFNDPIAILFLYAAINLFMDRQWTWGSICFSLGVSVKMNILLFAPAIFLLYLTSLGIVKTFLQIAICALVQLCLGCPFLITHPMEYLRGSFDLGRIFEHKWTVNYRFIDRDIFENKMFHLSLFILHLILLAVFASPSYKFLQSYNRLRALQMQFQPQIENANQRRKLLQKKLKKPASDEDKLTKDQVKFLNAFENTLKQQQSPTVTPANNEKSVNYSIHFDQSIQLALLPIFICNFIGILCARSLHYQFYVWYFHSLPYLLWSTDFNISTRYLLLGLIEFCWNTYPSTNVSSLLLHGCHIFLLIGLGVKLFRARNLAKKVK